MNEIKKSIVSQLQKEILKWQGFKPPVTNSASNFGLGAIEAAFPNGIFPTGAIHEFVSTQPEHAAASCGFVTSLLAVLMQNNGACLWISRSRNIFPPALKTFGVEPDRIIFIDLHKEKDVLWATEEALKCKGLAAVITEVGELSFMQSRRLQLAVEHSQVTGFIIRNSDFKLSTTACTARWKITPLPSQLGEGMPGVGFPRWHIELLKVRNGNPGSWKIEWLADRFITVTNDEDDANTMVEVLQVG